MPEPGDMMGRDRDLVLPPNTYAFVLDSTKGKVSVYVGPMRTSLSNTDQLVVWDSPTGRFKNVDAVERAVQTFQRAGEGQYIVLSNPASDAAVPMKGMSTEAVDLGVGRQVNVPGPTTFPLWPGQTAQTIEGHHLRHNQYLVVRIYDPEQAQANWESAVVAPQVGTDSPATAAPHTYAMGQLVVVKGTEVSFYIPPTGIEVVHDAESNSFIREAVTLERLEYCILLDENGEKRYMRGPDVVFPSPTEKFVIKDNLRKFTAIELNPHSGLFIKVVAEYEDGGVTHPVGEELFITGGEDPIYFPRAEHNIIQYGDKRVHHAVAIPAGEGRYVLDRDEGTVDLIPGPKMFLPDPRRQVVVLRILDPHIVDLLFPGNEEAMEINERYMQVSSRLGAGEHLSNREAEQVTAAMSLTTASAGSGLLRGSDRGYAETMRRGTTYTPPRTIVLDTKYEGAVTINIWPGYAVLVVDKSDNRRVEIGPKSVALQYDETVMPLTLSTGRPKNDTRLLRTGYLRITNNQVSDRVEVETRDLVSVTVDISYRVNFEAERGADEHKWFAVENYVKTLTDHCRSRLRNEAKRHGIQEFYTQTIDIIRDTLLGKVPTTEEGGSRTGLLFPENNMRLYDVEVLNVTIPDADVSGLLIDAQTSALTGAIELSTAEEAATRISRIEALARASMDDLELTAVKRTELELNGTARELSTRLAQVEADLAERQELDKIAESVRASTQLDHELELTIQRAMAELALARLTGETDERLRLTEALNEHMVVALQQFGDQAVVEKLITAVGPAAIATGVTSADLFGQIFKDTPFENVLGALTQRPLAANGGRRIPATSRSTE